MIKFFSLSKLVILFILFSVLFMIKNYNSINGTRGVIDSDVVQYYGYLPATFIYHDVSLQFTKTYQGRHKFEFVSSVAPNGGLVIKYTMGMSFMYSPFFYGAHWYAYLFGYDTGGYSLPYQIALLFSSLFYFIIGLHFLRKVLEKYFDTFIVAFVLLLIVFGTNLFYYATINGAMTHVYSFSLLCIFIFYTIKWYERQSWLNSLILGVVLGLITIIRPNNILMVLIFMFYGITSFKDIPARFRLFLKNYYWIVLMIFCVAALCAPQFFYWKMVTGNWFFYSYLDEHFFFNRPQFINGLFSFRKGWFVYTPVMLFATIGVFLCYKRLKSFFIPILLFLVIDLWIIFSWWCWWYGGSYGQRALIDIYGLMAIGLGVFLAYLYKQKLWIRYPVVILLLLLTFLNVFNSIQYKHGSLHFDSMTKKAYFYNFGHMEPYGNYYDLLQTPDYDNALKGLPETTKTNK